MRALFVIFFLLTSYFVGLSQYHKNITREGHLPYSECLSALWGYTDSQGREFALVGTCSGTSIVDITNPASPTEKYFVPGPPSIWREIKTWKHYAYIVTEGGNGLTIVDLSNLPDTNLTYTIFTNPDPITGTLLTNVHTLWIDEHGHCFLYGATGFGAGQGAGCVILDLNTNPMAPTLLGTKGGTYYHDGFVRGDTLWAAAIYDGVFEIIDISHPQNPQFLENRNTPGNFTHNTWLSDDGKTLFTTDEIPDAVITSYDVTDRNNIQELDRVQMDPAGNETPHNVHYLNGWLPTAYYREGVVIVDAHRPTNMVITGYYDTFFPDTGSSFGGVWETYPFFPSGRMIAGDRKFGLFVLKPNYVRACYLEGVVTDTLTGIPIPGASVFFSGLLPGDSLFTAVDGSYKTGAADSGLYLLEFQAPGYESKKMYLSLDNGFVKEQNAQLRPIGFTISPPATNFSEFLVWPVPASSTMEIRGIPFDITEIKLADANGKVVYTQNLNQEDYITIDVHNLASGTYFILCSRGNKKAYSQRIIVKH